MASNCIEMLSYAALRCQQELKIYSHKTVFHFGTQPSPVGLQIWDPLSVMDISSKFRTVAKLSARNGKLNKGSAYMPYCIPCYWR
jgi:hypothetical protein